MPSRELHLTQLALFEGMAKRSTRLTWRKFSRGMADYHREALGLETEHNDVDSSDGLNHSLAVGGGVRGDIRPPNFRAANEAAWAGLMDALGVVWKYEALEPELSRALRYQPDFWLGERRAWLEVKSSAPTPGEIRAARELLRADGDRVYMVAGWPQRKRYGLWLFAPAGEVQAVRNDMCDLALCQLFDCGWHALYAAFDRVRGRNY